LCSPNYIGCVAVLGKSLLPDCVSGLSVYVVEELKLGEKMLAIKNQKSKFNLLSLQGSDE